jgi:hypothetical protein
MIVRMTRDGAVTRIRGHDSGERCLDLVLEVEDQKREVVDVIRGDVTGEKEMLGVIEHTDIDSRNGLEVENGPNAS